MIYKIELYEPIKFNDDTHIQNFTKYLFNMTKKSFNKNTKYNMYLFDNQLFFEKDRESLYQVFSEKFSEIPYTFFRSQLMYFDVDEEKTLENFLKNEVNDLKNDINRTYPSKFELYVLHLNQGMPHFHRLFIV